VDEAAEKYLRITQKKFSSFNSEPKEHCIFALEFRNDMIELRPEQLEIIQKMSVFQVRAGMPPTEARILALLLVSDRTELTFDEIRETLNTSKSAVSTALNTLVLRNKIESINIPGDRKRYFKHQLRNWNANAHDSLIQLLSVNNLLKEILTVRTTETEEFNQDLKNVISFIDFLQLELVQVFQKWNDQQKQIENN
jgi:DNA-binding transcriptional regulator GbsR (MarR family)